MRAIPLLMAICPPVVWADQLPAYCGGVGAKGYTPPAVTIPAVVLNRGTVITVTNATVVVNGDTSSVKALLANPGPDGISIQEAILATNNDPGTWNIQFAPALKGSTIGVGPGLPDLTGGNVTINGDIDGDGKPDITLASMPGSIFFVLSGGNTLYGLALDGIRITIQPPAARVGLATGTTFSNITIANLVMTGAQQYGGIALASSINTLTSSPAPLTANTWDHLLITGNTISGTAAGPQQGIALYLTGTAGDTLQHTTIANNNIVLAWPNGNGINIEVGESIGSNNNQALDTLIANNNIAGAPIANSNATPSDNPWNGIRIAEGEVAASANLIDGMQIIANQIRVARADPANTFPTVTGILVQSGDGASDYFYPTLVPIQYSTNNISRNIHILSNTIEGDTNFGINVPVANSGNGNNAIDNLTILGNTMTGVLGNGVMLAGGTSAGDYSRPTAGNTLSNVLVQANTVKMTPIIFNGCNCYPAMMGITFGGIDVFAGWFAPGNSVKGITIANNDVDTPLVGIGVIGGFGGDAADPFSTDNNLVSGAQIFCNQVDQAPTLALAPYPGVKGINVTAGVLSANGNQVQQLYVADNLIAGILSAASTPAYLGTSGSGNTISTSSTPTPAISFVANAEGESPVIAPNTWIEIKGVNLAPQLDALNLRIWTAADFLNNQMPVQLDGVGVAVNGKNAYVWYVSPSQVNVLTSPDAVQGLVNVVVTNNGTSSQTYAAQAQALSPSFFVFDGTHVAATHLDGTDIGATTLYPGLTTPAKPGETIVIYGNGFGATSTQVVGGAITQSGNLAPMPVITIGGIKANVRFAGLNGAPGEFQFNVDVPLNVPDGDQPVTATYKGVATQVGALLAVQH